VDVDSPCSAYILAPTKPRRPRASFAETIMVIAECYTGHRAAEVEERARIGHHSRKTILEWY